MIDAESLQSLNQSSITLGILDTEKKIVVHSNVEIIRKFNKAGREERKGEFKHSIFFIFYCWSFEILLKADKRYEKNH